MGACGGGPARPKLSAGLHAVVDHSVAEQLTPVASVMTTWNALQHAHADKHVPYMGQPAVGLQPYICTVKMRDSCQIIIGQAVCHTTLLDALPYELLPVHTTGDGSNKAQYMQHLLLVTQAATWNRQAGSKTDPHQREHGCSNEQPCRRVLTQPPIGPSNRVGSCFRSDPRALLRFIWDVGVAHEAWKCPCCHSCCLVFLSNLLPESSYEPLAKYLLASTMDCT